MISRTLARMPALPLCVGVVAGILAVTYCGATHWAALAASVAGLALIVFRFYYTGFTALFFATAVLMAGRLSACDAPTAVSDGRDYAFSGRVLSDYGDDRLIVRIDSVRTVRDMYPLQPFKAVVVSNTTPALICGDRIRFIAAIEPIRSVEDMPYVTGPYVSMLQSGVRATASTAAPIETVGHDGGLDSWGAARRRDIRRALIRGGTDGLAFGFYEALFTASRQSLPADTAEHFRAAGIAHALALSGFHVGFIVFLATLVFFPLRAFSHHRWLHACAVITAVWAFATLTGFPASVTRAAVMFSVYSIARLIGRASSSWNSLLLAAAVILMAAPAELFSAGFQLSFAAVAGILAFSRALNPVNPRRHRLYLLMQLPAVSVAATMGTCVVTVYYFHTLPLHFILANILITLLLPVIMTLGLMVLITGALSLNFALPGICANWICHATDRVASMIASLPSPVADGSLFLSEASVAALLALVVAAAVWVNFPLRRVVVACIVVALLSVSTAFIAAPAHPVREVYCVNSNTNAAIVMRDGPTVVAMVTASPRWADKARADLQRSLTTYLRSRGCDSVIVIDGDFEAGIYRRDGQFLTTGRTVTAIPMNGRRVDSARVHVHYALVTMRCRATCDSVIARLHPDTIVLAAGLTPIRRAEFTQSAIRARIPLIDTKTRPWSPAL